jgi:calcineurin-like phosphoesterase family protein
MQKRALVVMVAVLTSCRAFIGRYGPEPARAAADPVAAIDREVKEAYDKATLTPVVAADAELNAFFDADRTVCLAAPIVLRFAWTSDVQLRQHSVKLFSSRTSRTLDDVIPSFERDPLQETLGWAVYLANVKAVDLYARGLAAAGDPTPVSFLIHTGDAIDSGTIEELYRFVRVTNQSVLPWLNVPGNHDTSIFGNYQKNLTYTSDAFVDFYPVGRRGFLAMHAPERRLTGFGPELMPVPIGGHPPSESGKALLGGGKNPQTIPQTDCHGFDLAGPPKKPCWDYPGYYALDVPGAARVRVIALDTTRHVDWGAEGELSAEQAAWLKEQLAAASGSTALLFSHHQPLPAVLDAIAASGHSRVFYFSGHTHQAGVYLHQAGRTRVVELNGASILEYPQVSRIVELRQPAAGPPCVVSRAIWPSSFDAVRAFDWGQLSAKWTACAAEPLPSMTLERASACGHLGAMADWVHNDERWFEKPQRPEATWRATNAIVTLPRGSQE